MPPLPKRSRSGCDPLVQICARLRTKPPEDVKTPGSDRFLLRLWGIADEMFSLAYNGFDTSVPLSNRPFCKQIIPDWRSQFGWRQPGD